MGDSTLLWVMIRDFVSYKSRMGLRKYDFKSQLMQYGLNSPAYQPLNNSDQQSWVMLITDVLMDTTSTSVSFPVGEIMFHCRVCEGILTHFRG